MENGKDYIPPDLSKGPKSLWKAPFCNKCNDVVEHWLYLPYGHTDGTPLVLLNCHKETHTYGTRMISARLFREEMTSRFESGKERLELNTDGTYNGPIEKFNSRKPVDSDDGTGSRNDNSSLTDQTPRGDSFITGQL